MTIAEVAPSSVPVNGQDLDPGWATSARRWGIFTGIALLVGALAYLIEANGFLGTIPTYAATSAGQLRDEATYWVAFFSYRNSTLWDYFLRDGAFFFAFLGFIPIVLSANVATGGRRAAVQIGAGFVAAGALFGALNAVTFFVDVSWWRIGGWDTVPPEIMAAIGRTSDFMDDLSAWSGTASNAAFAVALFYLGRACLTEPALPRRMAPLAFIGAALEAILVVLVVVAVPTVELLRNLVGIATGVFVAPAIALWLGIHLGRVLSART